MKSIIITGCTSGLGKAFHDKAVKSALLDTRCVFLGRNLERLEQSADHQYCEFNLLNEQQVDWDKLYSANGGFLYRKMFYEMSTPESREKSIVFL